MDLEQHARKSVYTLRLKSRDIVGLVVGNSVTNLELKKWHQEKPEIRSIPINEKVFVMVSGGRYYSNEEIEVDETGGLIIRWEA